jgi:hypothetical protein
LSKVLAALATLEKGDLDVVVATASSLRARFQTGAVRAKRGPRKAKSNKEPAKQDSKFADVKERKAFKDAEKELRSFLKARGALLKDFSEGESKNPPPVARFFEARNCWFRTKASLSNETSAGTPQNEEEEVPTSSASGSASQSWADRN